VRYLILSDIHANRDALEAVVDDARGRYDEILCCGDLVGYGADPNAVVDWTRSLGLRVVRCNHDKASVGLEDLEWFNPVARAAAEWTARALSPENQSYLRALPKGPLRVDSFQILHGSPLDEDDYVVSSVEVAELKPYLETDVSFFGHSHLQGGFLCHRNGVIRIPRVAAGVPERVVAIEPETPYLLNPGSVGQPRDRDPRAAYLVYSPGERLIEFRRVPYDVRAAQEKIRAAGLPGVLADRLEFGQ
jgi:diadenosine tetraphosphatase ApaH/serine/threonine PP2A family protein phosphatase